MPTSAKVSLPPVTENRTAAAFLQALGEPTRLNIVRLLSAGPSNVTEIATALQTEIVNTSHHLGVMRSAGVLQDRKDGRFVIYSLACEYKTTTESVTLTGPGVKVVVNLIS